MRRPPDSDPQRYRSLRSQLAAGPVAGHADVRVRLRVGGGWPGKSTLAQALAAELRPPLLAKDEIKEALADVLGGPETSSSRSSSAEPQSWSCCAPPNAAPARS